MRRTLAIGAATIVMAVLVVGVGRRLVASGEEALLAPAAGAPQAPIPAEADVFRTLPGALSAPADARTRDRAHPRTLAMYRAVRAYPGAPPRVAHGLTAEEYRTASCLGCHEKGGFSPRFGLFAPVTPHPEYRECLQCHVPDARLVGLPLPSGAPDAKCLQCHTPGASTPAFVALDWPAPTWPELDGQAMEGSPPWIPHDLQLRGNCLACHAGPGAVEELRTTHPERANCRQCHVQAPAAEDVFTRPLDGRASAPEAGS